MRTDRHDEAVSRLWQFCERVYKLNKVSENASVSIFGWNVERCGLLRWAR